LAGAWLGIASEGFPEFGQFYSPRFHGGTQSLKSDASTISPRPQQETYNLARPFGQASVQ